MRRREDEKKVSPWLRGATVKSFLQAPHDKSGKDGSKKEWRRGVVCLEGGGEKKLWDGAACTRPNRAESGRKANQTLKSGVHEGGRGGEKKSVSSTVKMAVEKGGKGK